MKATVSLDHGMTFVGSANSGFTLQMGASQSVGGDEDGFRPMELLLIGIGGCTAMDVISILRKKRQDVTGLEIVLDAEQAESHPHIFTNIRIKYIVHGHLVDPVAVERAIALSETKYCPAQAMFSKIVKIELSYEIIEEAMMSEVGI